ncbi:NAD-dependent epimerase/dehydratase family protein [Peterkaempfera sp. SMS 1(5)a]|uniref:NAD-dependent epimerase/dehydratase family protein n=1 Tax=Peterkaempfera podocarpi TaxID=3232308 RepID=UPI00366F67D1
MGKVVLVTGVARQLGARFVRAIRQEPDVDLVVGVDLQPPVHDPDPLQGPDRAGAEGRRDHVADYVFVRADIRRPAVARVIAEYSVDTVVHMHVSATLLGSGGRGTVKETNVIGTMQLLGACQKSPTVQRLVVKSTTSVYGSAPRDPAVFSERMQPRALPSGGFAKDAVEVEGYVRGFARRRPDVAVSVLRFANIIGPAADTPLAEYFSLPVLPTALGYDPRLQFVHEDDAVEVLRLASLDARRGTTNSGTFNVAGEGVLLLSQCARRLGRPTVPLLLPAINWVAGLVRQTRIADFSPEQIRLLTHGRVVDVTQLHETFGYRPRRTTAEAFADFAAHRAPGLLPPERLTVVADRLAGLLPPAGRSHTTQPMPPGPLDQAAPAPGTLELDLR